jgi:hypothetical protein
MGIPSAMHAITFPWKSGETNQDETYMCLRNQSSSGQAMFHPACFFLRSLSLPLLVLLPESDIFVTPQFQQVGWSHIRVSLSCVGQCHGFLNYAHV